jgi:hypothetical protein
MAVFFPQQQVSGKLGYGDEASMIRSPDYRDGRSVPRSDRPTPGRNLSGRQVEGFLMIITQRRWDNVERGVKLALRIAAGVVQLIIEIRGVR